jgi:hypothetical protein
VNSTSACSGPLGVSARDAQNLGHTLVDVGEKSFALDAPNSRNVRIANSGLQLLQKGNQALGGGLLQVVIAPERRTDVPADAIELVDVWPGIHGDITRHHRSPFPSAANNLTECCCNNPLAKLERAPSYSVRLTCAICARRVETGGEDVAAILVLSFMIISGCLDTLFEGDGSEARED